MATTFTYGKLYTLDNVSYDEYLSGMEFPMISLYNDKSYGFDYRGLLCEDANEEIMKFSLPITDRFQRLGPNEIPFLMGHTLGRYQQFVRKFGGGVGRDSEFLRNASSGDIFNKAKETVQADIRTIRYEVLKCIFNPPAYGHGFYNQTWDSLSTQTAPPNFKSNSFTGTHTHYTTTGAATITTIDPFIDAKAHIREHAEVTGDFVGFMNSTQQGQLEKLLGAYGATKPSSTVSITEEVSKSNFAGNLSGINWFIDDDVPAGYTIVLAPSIRGSKPIKFHQSTNESWRGLIFIPGPTGAHPLVGSYYERYFYPRVWARDAGVVMQWTTAATYSVPSFYA